MSIKERLKQSDSKLAGKRKEYESMQASIEALRASLQQKEEKCAELKTQLDTAKDPQVALVEELIDASRQLVKREELYHKVMESGAVLEEEAQKDHRLIMVYREQPELQEQLKSVYLKAQSREEQRKQLKERLPLEVIVARERIGEQVNTAVITPITTEQYQTYHHQSNQTSIIGMLTEWVGVNLVKAQVQPQSGEYHGFFKAIIPGTPELKFDSALPDEFEQANISVERVMLEEEELLLGEKPVVAPTLEKDRAYLDTIEAARMAGVSYSRIYRLIASGKIDAKRVRSGNFGTTWLIDQASLDAFLVKSGKRAVESVPTAAVAAESKEEVVGEYTLSTEKKVNPTEYYSLVQTAELLGYKDRDSVAAILQRDTQRRKKGIAPRLPAEECGPGGRRGKWRILGQSIIDYDERKTGKSKPGTAAAPPTPRSVDEVMEYTLSTGKKVDSTKYYDTGQTAELLGYGGGGSVLGILKRDAGRREKGIAPLLPAEKCSPYSGGGRVPWRILGQSIIDFDEKRTGKGKAVAVPPPKSVDEVVLPETPPVEQRAITVPEQETFTLPEIAEVLGVSYTHVGSLIKHDPRSEQWKVKGHSRTGYVYGKVPRTIVVELAEKCAQRAPRKVVQASADPNLMGVVEASGYLAKRLRECGVEYSASTIGTGLIARKYARNYLEHKPGLKLPAEKGEKDRILVRRDGLEDFVDEYVKEEVIKPKIKAGESYEEITTTLPKKYYDSIKAFLARRSHGDYKVRRRKAGEESVTPPLEGAAAEGKDYFSTTEAAGLIGVSSRAVQMYITQGKITAERKDADDIRSAWRISKVSLDEYLVKIGKKTAPAEPVTPAAPTAPQPVLPVPPAEAQPPTPTAVPPKPPLPAGELERRYQAITSTLGENYASKIRATTNGNISDIEQKAFDETYLPLLNRVWPKIREMHPQEIPEELSPICRPATFSDPERLTKLEAKVNLQYTQFIEKNAEKRKLEKETGDKVALLRMYAGLDEERAKTLIPNLELDGGVGRIDTLEKALTGVAKGKATDATTKILSAKPEILTTQFDFAAYQAKLAFILGGISMEYPDEIPQFYHPLQSPQNFISVEALENVERALRKAVSRRERDARLRETAPDKDYYDKYSAQIVTGMESEGYNLGMVCTIIDHGLNAERRKPFGDKAMSEAVLRKKVSGKYRGRMDSKTFNDNLRKLVGCGALIADRHSGSVLYTMPTELPATVPVPLREILQPLYTSNGTTH